MCNNEKRANHLLACDQPFLDGGGFQRIRTAVAAFAELCLTARPGNPFNENGCKEKGFPVKYASLGKNEFYFLHPAQLPGLSYIWAL